MVVMVLERVSASLRGELTRWLLEAYRFLTRVRNSRKERRRLLA